MAGQEGAARFGNVTAEQAASERATNQGQLTAVTVLTLGSNRFQSVFCGQGRGRSFSDLGYDYHYKYDYQGGRGGLVLMEATTGTRALGGVVEDIVLEWSILVMQMFRVTATSSEHRCLAEAGGSPSGLVGSASGTWSKASGNICKHKFKFYICKHKFKFYSV